MAESSCLAHLKDNQTAGATTSVWPCTCNDSISEVKLPRGGRLVWRISNVTSPAVQRHYFVMAL